MTAVAGEHVPVVGPPGTAKLRFCGSDLVIAADGGRLAIFDIDRGALRIVGPRG